jgi:hypothetical protein
VKLKENIEEVFVTFVQTKEETLSYSVLLSSKELTNVEFVSVLYC